jgi:hypothetical protein
MCVALEALFGMLLLIKGLRRVLKGYNHLETPSVVLVLDISHGRSSITQFTKGQTKLGLTFPFLLLKSHELTYST